MLSGLYKAVNIKSRHGVRFVRYISLLLGFLILWRGPKQRFSACMSSNLAYQSPAPRMMMITVDGTQASALGSTDEYV